MDCESGFAAASALGPPPVRSRVLMKKRLNP
jgi:hypothetical protein